MAFSLDDVRQNPEARYSTRLSAAGFVGQDRDASAVARPQSDDVLVLGRIDPAFRRVFRRKLQNNGNVTCVAFDQFALEIGHHDPRAVRLQRVGYLAEIRLVGVMIGDPVVENHVRSHLLSPLFVTSHVISRLIVRIARPGNP